MFFIFKQKPILLSELYRLIESFRLKFFSFQYFQNCYRHFKPSTDRPRRQLGFDNDQLVMLPVQVEWKQPIVWVRNFFGNTGKIDCSTKYKRLQYDDGVNLNTIHHQKVNFAYRNNAYSYEFSDLKNFDLCLKKYSALASMSQQVKICISKMTSRVQEAEKSTLSWRPIAFTQGRMQPRPVRYESCGIRNPGSKEWL